MIINVQKETLVDLLFSFQDGGDAARRCLNAVLGGHETVYSIGKAVRKGLLRTYEIRLEHLKNLGIDVIGGDDLLRRLAESNAVDVGGIALEDSEFSLTVFIEVDLGRVIACVGVKKQRGKDAV